MEIVRIYCVTLEIAKYLITMFPFVDIELVIELLLLVGIIKCVNQIKLLICICFCETIPSIIYDILYCME